MTGRVDGPVNTARAVVASKMYLGDEVQVVATLDGGTRMLVREQRAGTDDSHDAIRPGDPITIQWERTAPVLLAESPDPAQQQRCPMNENPDQLNILAPIETKSKMDALHRQVERAAGHPMSRRSALGLGGLMLLAACGSTSTGTGATGGATASCRRR